MKVKELKELTKEEMVEEINKGKEKIRNDFIDKLLEDVKWLQEKSFKTEYKPTDHERQQFAALYKIITGMNKWF